MVRGVALLLVVGASGAFSLPGSTDQETVTAGRADFFFAVFFFAVMGRFSKVGDEFVRVS